MHCIQCFSGCSAWSKNHLERFAILSDRWRQLAANLQVWHNCVNRDRRASCEGLRQVNNGNQVICGTGAWWMYEEVEIIIICMTPLLFLSFFSLPFIFIILPFGVRFCFVFSYYFFAFIVSLSVFFPFSFASYGWTFSGVSLVALPVCVLLPYDHNSEEIAESCQRSYAIISLPHTNGNVMYYYLFSKDNIKCPFVYPYKATHPV